MIVCADARAIPLQSDSVQTVVTSPPYWGLRDYGLKNGIGLEESPDAWVEQMVVVFRELRRVLRDDGTVWLNVGDAYVSGQGGRQSAVGELPTSIRQDRPAPKARPDLANAPSGWAERAVAPRTYPGRDSDLKPKDLYGLPWRLAFALQADGWYLRSDIIWAKRNPMPESVRDRPTKSHEHIFLLTKRARYYYDQASVAEAATNAGKVVSLGAKSFASRQAKGAGVAPSGNALASSYEVKQTRNLRDVWTFSTEPFPEAHFATFPKALVVPCIKAGSRPPGRRCDCDELILTPLGSGPIDDPSLVTGRAGMNRPRRPQEGTRPITRREQRAYAEQMRLSPHRAEMERRGGAAFAHYIRTDRSGARPLPPMLLADWMGRGWLTEPDPCSCPEAPGDLVLDPFAGSGTTGVVARSLGRRFAGLELKFEYAQMSRKRIRTEGGD